jgi:hypothetical protein
MRAGKLNLGWMVGYEFTLTTVRRQPLPSRVSEL